MTGAPPLISQVWQRYWDALARHEIAMQRCDGCGAWVFYPRPFCPECSGRSLTWTPVAGPAFLYSWTIAQVPVAKAFSHLDKPILAVVELANAMRIPTTLVDTEQGTVKIGMALKPVFDGSSYEGITVLRFRADDDDG